MPTVSINKPVDPADATVEVEHRLPERTDRILRCDAQVYGTYDAKARRWNMHRCRKSGSRFDAGRWVCPYHFKDKPDGYICGNRFVAFGRAMARALGDEP
jgi:hypothetical protein